MLKSSELTSCVLPVPKSFDNFLHNYKINHRKKSHLSLRFSEKKSLERVDILYILVYILKHLHKTFLVLLHTKIDLFQKPVTIEVRIVSQC